MTRQLLLLAVVAVLGVAVLGVAGCGGGRAAAGAPADPFALVGTWRVTGTEQQVQFDPAGFEIVDGCHTLLGTWRADPGGRFVATVDSVQPCPDGSGADPSTPPWPGAAAGFAVEGADRVLRDRTGAELVRLTPGGPVEGTGLVDPGRAPTADEQRAAGPAAPLPSGLAVAEPADLLGRWVPAGPQGPFVEFTGEGTWSGSDGCNGTGGAWVAGPDGAFLATASSVRTLIACAGVDVAPMVGGARTAALDGPVLVLLDVSGAELGRFDRD